MLEYNWKMAEPCPTTTSKKNLSLTCEGDCDLVNTTVQNDLLSFLDENWKNVVTYEKINKTIMEQFSSTYENTVYIQLGTSMMLLERFALTPLSLVMPCPSLSKINKKNSKKNFIQEYQFRRPFFVKNIFFYTQFLNHFIF